MSKAILPSELKAGDVLLYRGTAWVSDMIRLFDGGGYSHSGIYDGSKVAEVIADGLVYRWVGDSIEKHKSVHVWRFRSSTGHELDDPEYGAMPVIDRIRHYVAQGANYAYEGVILLAFLVATRRLPFDGWVPGLGRMLRTIFDSAADALNEILSAGREPMICSELIYRCYCEAGDPYKLEIVGADILRQYSIHDSVKRGAPPFTGFEGGNREVQELAASAEAFLHRFAAATKTETRAVPDFVTPRDLEYSPTLHYVGALKEC